ncbi:TPM domain-containing protein [Rhodococcus phenolicus]|uniref:TPM domain-containing protein n=1 Tax=Rhodococcus phenolicus TaxID=263849 RepID=UPI0008373EC9|nr:TPM domain-containing protein [Rhodococcus phenolicus]
MPVHSPAVPAASTRPVPLPIRAAVPAVLALLMLLLWPAAASADTPLRLPGQITDSSGVLNAGAKAEVQDALDALYGDHQVQLWVAYVPSFSGMSGDDWTEATARASGFGPKTALLAVATTDRDYNLWVSNDVTDVSDAEITAIATDQVRPQLVEQDWAGAAIAAAEGLDDALNPTSVTPLLVGGGVVVAGAGGVYLYTRRSKRKRAEAGAEAAASIDPTDTAALAALPPDVLDARAKDILVDTDNAVRTSAEELELARGEFGDQAVAPFATAFAQAQAALAKAFEIRQRLDDAIPETPQQRRDMLVDLISTCGRAGRELDSRVTEFDGMRDLLLDAPARLDALTQQVVTLTARVPASEAVLTALRAEFPAETLAPVAQNTALAREQLGFAEKSIAEGRDAIALPAGKQGPAVGAIRAAESALIQASTLLDGIDHAETDIRHAMATLPAAVADLEQGVAAAEQLAASGGPDLANAAAAATEALAHARASQATDPLGSFTRVVDADATLDAVLASTREAQEQAERARQKLQQDLTAAQSQVTSAADFIGTRRGAVGAEARTRLSEAQRHLQAAQQLASTDAAQALQHAQAATQLGAKAMWAAQSDVRQWEQRQQPRSSGTDMTGAILGGILIDSILRGGGGGGYSRGGGYRGGSGRGPGSFGGPSSSGRIGRSSGGRF